MPTNAWFDPTTAAARQHVLAPTASMVRQVWDSTDEVRLLDVGCGDMLLSELLPISFTVDGYDPDPAARDAARQRVGTHGNSAILDSLDQTAGRYDGVILNSVVQYLTDIEALIELMRSCHNALESRDGAILIVDVVPPGRSPSREALEFFTYLRAGVGFRVALSTCLHAARTTPPRITEFGDEDVDSAARAVGARAVRCQQNAAPLSRRATYVVRSSSEPAS